MSKFSYPLLSSTLGFTLTNYPSLGVLWVLLISTLTLELGLISLSLVVRVGLVFFFVASLYTTILPYMLVMLSSFINSYLTLKVKNTNFLIVRA